MTILLALLLVLVLFIGLVLTLVGMPGNWLMVATAAIYVCFVPTASPVALDWKVVVMLAVLAALGELVELAAGAAGTAKAGGSRRGIVLALVGSVAGALVGIVFGLPIPLVGPLVAALIFAGLGAMAGAILGEVWAGKDFDASWQIGKSAFWGRLLGTLGKMFFGAIMLAVVVAALVFY